MNNQLKNKKILFFSPAFFGYESKIKEKMEALGAEVFYYNERVIDKSYQKALLKINPNIFAKKTEHYFLSILEDIKDIQFDYIFFLKCEMPTKKVLDIYRNHFSKSFFCLYMWDSLANVINIEHKLPYFDKIYSFDADDCRKFQQLIFRPLFFTDDYRIPYDGTRKNRYALSFVGTIHSDRYKIIKEVKKLLENYQLNCFFYNFLQSQFMYTFYKLTKKEFWDTKKTDFKYCSLDSQIISQVIEDSSVILDIQHPKQSGLTMRTIEMLGMNKKLITTNDAIKEYDFYNPANIYVIARENIVIDKSFFEIAYEPLANDIYEKYSLEHWILEILKKES